MNTRYEKLGYFVLWGAFACVFTMFGMSTSLAYIHLMGSIQTEESEISTLLIKTIGYNITHLIMGATMIIPSLVLTNWIFNKKLGEVYQTLA